MSAGRPQQTRIHTAEESVLQMINNNLLPEDCTERMGMSQKLKKLSYVFVLVIWLTLVTIVRNYFQEKRENKNYEKKIERFFMSNTKQQCFNNDRKNAEYYFSQYCGASSIHGIQYLGERGRYILERVFWIIVVIIVTVLCLILIGKTYHKWVTSPVIVSFSSTEASISTIPFPSITICPEVKSDTSIFNYTDIYWRKMTYQNITSKEKKYWEPISLLCNDDAIDETHDFIEDDDILRLIEVFPELDPLGISSVHWIGDKKQAIDYIDFLFTSEGICYNFNMLKVDDILKDANHYPKKISGNAQNIKSWSLDGGYPNVPINNSYPRRTALTGLSGGFLFDSMYVNSSNLDYFCGDSIQGFKVVLHHPADWPNLDRHIRIPLDSAVLAAIKPRLTTISDNLKGYSPQNRKCYLADEKQLLYFKVYTQSNCMEECFANFTLRRCNCQAFYMPKFHDSPICGPKKLTCIQQSKVNYLREDGDKCACLPSCTSLDYDLELTQSDWNWKDAFNVFRIVNPIFNFTEFENAHLSKFGVYFKESQFLSTERHELYGIVDFFANIGGLMGLFIGISVTSFIEIFYFCTLRLCCNYKKYGRKFWSGEEKLLNGNEENFK